MWFLDRKSQDLFPRKPQIFSPLISVSELFMAERNGPALPGKATQKPSQQKKTMNNSERRNKYRALAVDWASEKHSIT
jgi:hypothetical protein